MPAHDGHFILIGIGNNARLWQLIVSHGVSYASKFLSHAYTPNLKRNAGLPILRACVQTDHR